MREFCGQETFLSRPMVLSDHNVEATENIDYLPLYMAMFV